MYSTGDSPFASIVCEVPVTVTLELMCNAPPASVMVELRRLFAKVTASSPEPAVQLLVPALSLFAESSAWRNVQVLAVPASPPVVTVMVAASAAGTPRARAIASGNSRRERSEIEFMTAPVMK